MNKLGKVLRYPLLWTRSEAQAMDSVFFYSEEYPGCWSTSTLGMVNGLIAWTGLVIYLVWDEARFEPGPGYVAVARRFSAIGIARKSVLYPR